MKRETTKTAHNTEKTITKAWECVKREATNAANYAVGQVIIAAGTITGITADEWYIIDLYFYNNFSITFKFAIMSSIDIFSAYL